MAFVRRQDHSPLAGRHVLCHVKAKATETTECAGLFTLVGGLDSVSAVFNNREAMSLRNRDERVHVASKAGEVDRNDGFRMARDFGLHLARIDIEGRGVHIGQNGFSARVNDGIYGRTEGESRRNDFISRADAGCQHAQVECRRARVYRHRIRRSLVVAQLALQLSDLRAGSKPAGPETTQYLALLFVADQRRPKNQKFLGGTYWLDWV